MIHTADKSLVEARKINTHKKRMASIRENR